MKVRIKLTPRDVEKVARLAQLPITETEKKIYSEQLSRILEAFDEISSCQTDKVSPTFNVTALENVMRKDRAVSSLSQEEALSCAPRKKNSLFVAEKVFEK